MCYLESVEVNHLKFVRCISRNFSAGCNKDDKKPQSILTDLRTRILTHNLQNAREEV